MRCTIGSLALAVVAVVAASCSGVPSGERDPALVTTSTATPATTVDGATSTTAEAPLPIDKGAVDFSGEHATVAVLGGNDAGELFPIYGPFEVVVDLAAVEVREGAPFTVDINENFVELTWNEDAAFDELEGIAGASLGVFVIVFDRPVLTGLTASSLTFSDLVPVPAIPEPTTLSITIPADAEVGDGSVARVLLSVLAEGAATIDGPTTTGAAVVGTSTSVATG